MSQTNGIKRVKQADGTYKTVVVSNETKAVTTNEQGKTVTQILAEDVAAKNHVHNYSSNVPSTQALGGVEKGFTTDGLRLEELFYRMLHPYVQPSIQVSCSPNGSLYETGYKLDAVNLSVNAIAQSDLIQQVRVYKNGEILHTVDHNVEGDCKFDIVDENVVSNAVYKADVFDGTNTISSASITFNFVRPVFVGNLPEDLSLGITASMIENLEKKIICPSSFCNKFTLENSRMCIAIPPGWTINCIRDHNGFDITNSFEIKSVDVLCMDGQIINYKFFISNVTSQSGFVVKFFK